MGIKNLMKVVHKFAPEAIKYKKIDEYKNKTLGIDANLMIYKMVFAIRKNGYDLKKEGKITTHIHSILQKIFGFKRYNITPIFVFDGGFPKIKEKTMKDRRKFKEMMQAKYYKAVTQDEKKKYFFMKSDITQQEIEDVKELIKIFGYQVVESTEEADSELAHMSKKGLIDGVITDDMDILVFGGKKLLKNFTVSDKKKIQEIDLKVLLKKLGITHDQLIDIGILLGCDYCPTIKGIGPINSYRMIKEHGSLQKLLDKGIVKLNTDYSDAKKYFKNPPVTKDIKKIRGRYNEKKLVKFLEKMGYSLLDIQKVFDKLK